MRSKFHLIKSLLNIKVAFCAILFFVLFFPQYEVVINSSASVYHVYVNGELVGSTNSKESVQDYYSAARREIALDDNTMKYISYPEITLEEEAVTVAVLDSEELITQNIKNVLQKAEEKKLVSAYSIKVNGMLVNVEGTENVQGLFKDTVAMYDEENLFDVSLKQDFSREFDVYDAKVEKHEVETAADTLDSVLVTAGLEKNIDLTNIVPVYAKPGFEQYDLGVMDMRFSSDIEIVKAYLPDSQIIDRQSAKGILTEMQETKNVYKVQTGDTLSEISLKVGLPLDRIIALNDTLDDENSNIFVDQELLITVPKPELAVVWTRQEHVSESYELDVQYIYNDSWYTNKSVTRQQPSAGYREAIAYVTYENENEVKQDILYEEVYEQAVAKVVEVGTLVPPTYIKPIAGGRMSSGFGKRSAPTKGASTYHKGIDWATPVGTPVYASSGGVVAKAGWGSGYGYVVYINHPDGRQTRYGHLSKVKVSAGQTVKQGQIIAASGNTGRSTGPHVHFEILIGGSQVNPLNYMY